CYFPADGSDVYLRGFYPSTGWAVGSNANFYEYTIDGKSDVMSANEVKTNKAEALAGTYQELVFNHLLTKLIIKVEAEDEAAEKAWGKITDMYLTQAAGNKITPIVRVNMTEPATNAIMYAADSNDTEGDGRLDSLYCYSIDAAGEATDKVFAHENGVGTPTSPIAGTPVALTYAADGDTSFEAPEVAYTLVRPVTAPSKHYKLVVRTENNLEAYPVDITLNTKDTPATPFTTSTVGYAFEVKLTFSATEIMAKAKVTEWVEGGVTDITIQ
ncbi:MAG: hypothetical protein K2G10_01600, partial [Alistipes sp.]|nr:hypothetical protein [Alistipes sp.]